MEPRATVQHLAICSVEKLAELTQLPQDFLTQEGFTTAYLSGQQVVRIVCRTEDGSPGSVLFQTRLTGENRYQWRRNERPIPYGLENLQKAHDQGRLILVHHVTEVLALRRIGLPALALLDAQSRLDQLTEWLREIPMIFLMATEAEQGAVGQWIARSGLAPHVQTIVLSQKPKEVVDLTDVYREAPDHFLTTMNLALEAAVPWKESERVRQQADKERAWLLCETLVRHEHILELFAEALHQSGFAGDPSLAQLLFLSLTSRLLELPVSMVLKGPSGGGKSYLVSSVMAFFPSLAYHTVSSLSPRALAYIQESLKHRVLIVAEYNGMEDSKTEYLLRTLLSEGRIVYAVPVNRGGAWITQSIVIEGPTGLVLTTTRLKLHPENETRMLSVEISDTAQQTKAILAAQAAGARGSTTVSRPNYSPWQALQEWLQHSDRGELDVVIPYADRIAENMTNQNAVRLRRDFPRILQMVKTHALLHQVNRERDATNRIVASREDYVIIYRLLSSHMAVQVEATVSAEVRETVHTVGQLLEDGKNPVSLTSLARELGLDKSSVSRRVGQAVAAGFLRNREARQGLPARLVLGDAMIEATEGILPSPNQLWPESQLDK